MVTCIIDDDGRVWHTTHCSMLFNWVIKDTSSFFTTGAIASSEILLKLFICWQSPISICLNTPSLLCYIKWCTSVTTVTFIARYVTSCWHFTFQLKQNKHASTCKYLILLWYFADLNQQAIHATWAKLQEFIICRYRKVYIAMLNYLNNMADVYKCWYILYHCADTTTMAKCKKAEYCTLSIYIQGLILHTSNLPTLRIDWNS